MEDKEHIVVHSDTKETDKRSWKLQKNNKRSIPLATDNNKTNSDMPNEDKTADPDNAPPTVLDYLFLRFLDNSGDSLFTAVLPPMESVIEVYMDRSNLNTAKQLIAKDIRLHLLEAMTEATIFQTFADPYGVQEIHASGKHIIKHINLNFDNYTFDDPEMEDTKSVTTHSKKLHTRFQSKSHNMRQ
jgi:hypothetical protein